MGEQKTEYRQIGIIECRVNFEDLTEEKKRQMLFGMDNIIVKGINDTSYVKEGEISFNDGKQLEMKLIIDQPVILDLENEGIEGLITYNDLLRRIGQILKPLDVSIESVDFSNSILDDKEMVYNSFKADKELVNENDEYEKE